MEWTTGGGFARAGFKSYLLDAGKPDKAWFGGPKILLEGGVFELDKFWLAQGRVGSFRRSAA